MNSIRLVNPAQPQTLRIGTILLYVTAVMQLLSFVLYSGISPLAPIFGIILPALGAWGTANERKWGYYLAIVATAIPLLLILYYATIYGIGFITGSAISVLISVAMFALIVHPQSRSYMKTWFV
ncbi:MAG: hypothetical protein ACP5O0_04435 [Acidimicrobiales bacterium]